MSKQRPELPEAYRAIYATHYQRNREGRGAAGKLSQLAERWMHRAVARNADPAARTLEIGAGNLNHLQFEPRARQYDVVEDLPELYNRSPWRSRIGNFYRSLDEIADRRYDRIISIAAFEHYCNLSAVIRNCGRLLTVAGELRVAIPSEGTPLWTLGWGLTTGLDFRLRYGLDYGVLMRHEHVNTAAEIEILLRANFRDVRRREFGITAQWSLYQFFVCRRFGTELDIPAGV